MPRYRMLAIGIFGVAAPLVLLGLAAFLMWSIGPEVRAGLDPRAGVTAYEQLRPVLGGPEDYTLAAYLYAEAANKQVMLTKQVMKVVVIHIGFAVASVGIMLVMLGFGRDEASTVSGETAAGKVNVRLASFGALVFVAGALLAGVAGIMPNSYQGTGQPVFGGSSVLFEPDFALAQSCAAAGFPNDPACIEAGRKALDGE